MIIDPTTPVGKIRLRIGDWQDLPLLPDTVIQSALEDCQNNVPRAAGLCAQYILATLTAKTHRKLANIEAWSGEQFYNYIAFIKMTILNPHLSPLAPIPYSGGASTEHPLTAFSKEWEAEYATYRIPLNFNTSDF
jgi:hypothetical protein